MGQKLRKVLFVMALAAGVGAFAFGLLTWLNPEEGWQEIEADTKGRLSLAAEFSLRAELGAAGKGAGAERKELTVLFSEALVEAYAMFSPGADSEGGGIAWLNAHPGEERTLQPALAEALRAGLAAGRWIFLGPLTEMSDAMLNSPESGEAAAYDPRRSEECAAFVRAALPWIGDREAVRLELQPDNRARLVLSPECRAFCEDWGVSRWIDLGWTENACAADWIADRLQAAGYQRFVLTSRDGFARIGPGGALSAALPAWRDGVRRDDASAALTGPLAAVCLRADLPGQTRTWPDGTRRTAFLSLGDGLDHCGADCLLAASGERGCAALARALQPLITQDAIPESALGTLEDAWAFTRGETLLCRECPGVQIRPGR